jgi:hypothetical protein
MVVLNKGSSCDKDVECNAEQCEMPKEITEG